jgi:hypothetical protein
MNFEVSHWVNKQQFLESLDRTWWSVRVVVKSRIVSDILKPVSVIIIIVRVVSKFLKSLDRSCDDDESSQ